MRAPGAVEIQGGAGTSVRKSAGVWDLDMEVSFPIPWVGDRAQAW